MALGPAEAAEGASRARLLSRVSIRAAILALLFSIAASGVLAIQGSPASEGQQLFQQYCIGCHTIGGGVLIGPDLRGVTDRRDPRWLAQWIENPDQVRASGDPIAQELDQQFPSVKMPNLGLTPAQVDQIVAYLGTASGGLTTTTPAAAPLLAGDVVRGKELFTGGARFSGGGPACMACHSVAGLGALGGGQLGPDLTQSVNKFGEAGLDAFIANPPTQTMGAVWAGHALTSQERADVRAFLSQAAVSGRPANAVAQLALFAIAGAALLLGLAQWLWRKRLRAVRAPLVAAARR
jgi:mono/diheme cytochrome c family protein